uniref:Uncharacterized protein n=1 Tax=Lepeophtheirus salmonis TaxID=72036 RepID=A0A0K2SZL8_LEPSM
MEVKHQSEMRYGITLYSYYNLDYINHLKNNQI